MKKQLFKTAYSVVIIILMVIGTQKVNAQSSSQSSTLKMEDLWKDPKYAEYEKQYQIERKSVLDALATLDLPEEKKQQMMKEKGVYSEHYMPGGGFTYGDNSDPDVSANTVIAAEVKPQAVSKTPVLLPGVDYDTYIAEYKKWINQTPEFKELLTSEELKLVATSNWQGLYELAQTKSTNNK